MCRLAGLATSKIDSGEGIRRPTGGYSRDENRCALDEGISARAWRASQRIPSEGGESGRISLSLVGTRLEYIGTRRSGPAKLGKSAGQPGGRMVLILLTGSSRAGFAW